MKRRSFLRLLGLAPVVVAAPSLALPKPDNPKSSAGNAGLGEGEPGLAASGSMRSFVFETGEVELEPVRWESRDGKLILHPIGGFMHLSMFV
jgi:hypothetical protein